MSSKQWLAVAAWGLLPIAASAQQGQASYNPTDPGAPVNAVPYESAFQGFRLSSDEQASPDKIWRTANDEVGKLGGHAGHMKPSTSKPPAAPDVEKASAKQGNAVDHGKQH